ncbi:MAG TPA: universal stress protein [Myxococcaceae bacterium]|nr:universal stress protein [Myxococcaceae bacterium]
MAQTVRRILVPIDFSEHSRHALEHALSLAEPLGASVDLLHVWVPPRHVAPDTLLLVPGSADASLETTGLTHAGRELHAWLERYRSSPVLLQAHLERGHAAETIAHVAEHGYDLIVMGTHGRTGLARVMLGSVAQKVSTLAPCPVMTVRATEPESASAPSA